jgi:hypothetical protein
MTPPAILTIIAAAARQTAVASTSLHEGAGELAVMAEEMKKIVGRFTC